MSKTIEVELSYSGINKAITELKEYRDSLNDKMQRFVEILAEKGISVAESASSVTDNGVNYGDLILFTSETYAETNGASGCVLAVEKQKIIRRWRSRGGTKEAEVSPLMMAEFGSGVHAKSEEMLDGTVLGGRGTFPGQKHAFDEAGWYWVDEGSKAFKRSKGIAPSEPMYRAVQEMRASIESAAKEAFGE